MTTKPQKKTNEEKMKEAVGLLNFALITLMGLREENPELFGKTDDKCIDDIESFLEEHSKEIQESDPCKPTPEQMQKGSFV